MKTKTIITEITREDIVNILAIANYGSSWLAFDYKASDYKSLNNTSESDYAEDKMAKILLAGGKVKFEDYYAEGKYDYYGNVEHKWSESDGCMRYTITLKDIEKGILKAIDSDSSWWNKCARDLMTEDAYNLDQPEAECLCQLIMFGDEIYG